MKFILHIPTEQYGFIEADLEATQASVAAIYQTIKDEFRPKPLNELPKKEWRKELIELLLGGSAKVELHEKMSPKQKELYHEIELALAQIKRMEGYQNEIEPN